LAIDGGTFSVGQLVNAARLDFRSGSLNLTAGDLLVAEVGTFGSTLTIQAGNTLNVTAATNIGTGALITVSDNGTFTSGEMANDGELDLDGQTATVTVVGSLTNAGALRGQGRVAGAVTNTTTGSVLVDVGRRINFLGPAFTNAGHVSATGLPDNPAELVFDGTMTNIAGTGLITASSGRIRFNSAASNAGSLTIAGGDNHIYGPITNTGQIRVTGGATATFYGDVVQNGVLQVSESGTSTSVAVFLGSVTGSGGSTGDGDIFFEGQVSPGNSTGEVTYANNVFFNVGSRLQIELGGVAPGVQHDKIIVSGALQLGGELDVQLINGFMPLGGQSFTIATSSAGISGAFLSTSLPVVPGLTWQVDQTETDLVLSLTGVGMSADFDVNGNVDGNDFLRWQRGLGRINASREDGDANGDGMVDVADLDMWRSAAGGGGAAAALQSIPEPTALFLAATLAAGCVGGGSPRGRPRCGR
jgi:hypothetical protein